MFQSSNQSAAVGLRAIVPSDTVDVATRFRAIYVGGAGNISVKGGDGTVVSLVGVPVGSVLNVEVLRVNATGTTATNLVGLL